MAYRIIKDPAATSSTALLTTDAAEISAVDEKTTPVVADEVLIEDSADSYNKKSAQLGNLPFPSNYGNAANGTAAAENTVLATNATTGWTAGSGATLIGTETQDSREMVKFNLFTDTAGNSCYLDLATAGVTWDSTKEYLRFGFRWSVSAAGFMGGLVLDISAAADLSNPHTTIRLDNSSTRTQQELPEDTNLDLDVKILDPASVGSIGIRVETAQTASFQTHIWFYDIRERAVTQLESALDSDDTVLVPDAHTEAQEIARLDIPTTQSVLDFRDNYHNFNFFRHHKSLRDFYIDLSGGTDQHLNLATIFQKLSDGDRLVGDDAMKILLNQPASVGIYDLNEVVFDMQGARFSTSLDGVARVQDTSNGAGHFFSLRNMHQCEFRDWRLYGKSNVDREATFSNGPSGEKRTWTIITNTPVLNGTDMELDEAEGADEEVATNWEYYGIDWDGKVKADVYLKESASPSVNSDCQIWLQDEDGNIIGQRTIANLTGTNTAYQISGYMYNPHRKLRVHVKKLTATANTITIDKVTVYNHNNFASNVERSHGFMLNSDNYQLRFLDVDIHNMIGDAYGSSVTTLPESIQWRGGWLRNSRRHGLSVLGMNLHMLGVKISESGRGGWDFEPEPSTPNHGPALIEGCEFINIHNVAMLVTGSYASASRDISWIGNTIDWHGSNGQYTESSAWQNSRVATHQGTVGVVADNVANSYSGANPGQGITAPGTYIDVLGNRTPRGITVAGSGNTIRNNRVYHSSAYNELTFEDTNEGSEPNVWEDNHVVGVTTKAASAEPTNQLIVTGSKRPIVRNMRVQGMQTLATSFPAPFTDPDSVWYGANGPNFRGAPIRNFRGASPEDLASAQWIFKFTPTNTATSDTVTFPTFDSEILSVSTPTLAAQDARAYLAVSNYQGNLSANSINSTLTGQTSGATGVIKAYGMLPSDATGFISLDTLSGTFSAAEDVNIGSTKIAEADGAQTSGSLTTTTYYYRVAAMNANGHRVAAAETSGITLTGTENGVSMTLTSISGTTRATRYRVWRTEASGNYAHASTVYYDIVPVYNDEEASPGRADGVTISDLGDRLFVGATDMYGYRSFAEITSNIPDPAVSHSGAMPNTTYGIAMTGTWASILDYSAKTLTGFTANYSVAVPTAGEEITVVVGALS